jgi:hypothetical protein
MAVLKRPIRKTRSTEALTEVVGGGRRFILNRPLHLTVGFAEDHWLIDQDELGIYVFAPDWDELLDDFGYLFAEHWDYYAQTPENELGAALRPRKIHMVELVSRVVPE